MKKYFVSYFYKDKNGNWGMGNSIISIDRPMDTDVAIREVEKSLKGNFDGLAIINYKEMSVADE
jgi:hypothetical protein